MATLATGGSGKLPIGDAGYSGRGNLGPVFEVQTAETVNIRVGNILLPIRLGRLFTLERRFENART